MNSRWPLAAAAESATTGSDPPGMPAWAVSKFGSGVGESSAST
jgi:hypothetical protein